MLNARCLLAIAVLSLAAVAGSPDEAQAQGPGPFSWHGAYYHPQYGAPVAMVVPPTVHSQMTYSWGAAGTSWTPIWPRYRRAYTGGGGTVSYPPPAWPYHTDQLGVYYGRAPW